MNSSISSMLPVRQIAVAVLALFAATFTASAQMDRHPELKSRARAWTEFDGSFLVDTNSRADMLNFYWAVLARPYPVSNWTGSLAQRAAGTTDEAFRLREYAQLNAYRAMQMLPAAQEDTVLLPAQQAGALVLALNQQLSHDITPSWLGYSDVARDALATSNLAVIIEQNRPVLGGIVDEFIFDRGSENAAVVGHRSSLLWHNNTEVALGAAIAGNLNYSALSSSVIGVPGVAADEFIAWPAPGFVPLALLRRGDEKFRWSFEPSASFGERDTSAVSITAKIGTKEIVPQNVQHVRGFPVTWEFASADLDLKTLAQDTDVEITVRNILIRGEPVTYRYTVRLFNENEVKVVGASPKSPMFGLSTRGNVGNGERVMIAGFIVDGPLPVRIAIRAQGASLAQHGINKTMKKGRLSLYDVNSKKLDENTGWKNHPDWRLLQAAGVAPGRDDEPGMVVTLWPGAYTVILSDDEGAEGVGILEAFNIDNLTSGQIRNLSTRALVDGGENTLIAGFIVTGNQPRRVVIRAGGAGLAQHGIATPAWDTTMRVVRMSDNTVIARNDDWKQSLNAAGEPISTVPELVSDPKLAGFAQSDDRESAVILTLQPGAYTALAEPKDGKPGVGIVEFFYAP